MNPLSNTQMGVQLAQLGKRTEALPYLRRAVQMEAVNAEVWLWLAHVTPDLREYQYCLQQALTLNPDHPVAQQMQAVLIRAYPQLSGNNVPLIAIGQEPLPVSGSMATGYSQPLRVDAPLVESMQRQAKRRQGRRLLVMLPGLAMLIALAVVIGRTVGDGLFDSPADKSMAGGLTIEVMLHDAGNQPLRFAVSVPTTWVLADTSSNRWNAVRSHLIQSWKDGGVSIWERIETDVTQVTVDPDTGNVEPLVTIIESDLNVVQRDQQNPARLQLVRITTLASGDTSCAGMEQFAASQQENLERMQENGQNVVDNQIERQPDNHCIFVVHFRGQSPLSHLVEHIYVLYVPASENRLAEWDLTVIDSAHDAYRSDIYRIMQTIRMIPG
jgi:hypothetical protein